MKRVIFKLAPILMVCAIPLIADDFWNKKQPDQWSAEEVQRLLSDSPWAAHAKVSYEAGGGRQGSPEGRQGSPDGRQGGGGYPDSGGGGMPRIGGMGIPLPGGGGVGMPGGRPGGGSGPGGERRPSGDYASAKITVRWDSALPIRQALDQPSANDLCKSKAESQSEYYAICAVGLPASGQQGRRDDGSESGGGPDAEHFKQALLDQTSLHGKDLSSVFPKKVEVVPMGDTRAVLFLFPKDGRLGDSKELEFDSQVGRLRLKATFKPKDMKYHGKLEL